MDNVKCQSTCHIILDPPSVDKMCKGNTGIGSQPLFQSTQLTWMNVRHGSHQGESPQNELRDERTCGTTLASAYMLCVMVQDL